MQRSFGVWKRKGGDMKAKNIQGLDKDATTNKDYVVVEVEDEK